ncbi:MAG TPA: hypothetical protein G4N92_02930 [Anaerolineae bacterium]|nr:hypothetical protein [Anaerolineae bacterium]
MLMGIDLLERNGEIDWLNINTNHIRFVYIMTTEGSSVENNSYKFNYQEAKKAGLLVGSYHWLHPRSDSKQQADFFCRTARNEKGDLPPAVCLELHKPYSNDFEDRLQSFLEQVENQVGMKPVIYTSEKYWKKYLPNAAWVCDYPLWIDNPGPIWPGQMFPWAGWTVWQFSFRAELPRIDSKLGLNWFNGDEQDLIDLTKNQLEKR